MTIWDDRILELLRERGPASVGKIADSDEIRISNAHVSRRCKKMAENRLLNALGNGVYSITPEGEAYLDEEYDAERGIYLDEVPEVEDGEDGGAGTAGTGEG